MTHPRTWLTDLCRQSLGDFELTPEIDADLSRRALVARSDNEQRVILFSLLAWKINRFRARYQRWNLRPWDEDDIVQEAWLAFDDVLRSWTPLDGNGGPAGFGYYLMAVYPRRLSDRVHLLLGTRRRNGAPVPLPWVEEADNRSDPDDLETDIVTEALLAAICGRLNAADATILRLAATTELDRASIAARANISRRTLYRRWPEITTIAREVLRDAG
jgi:DNA-directed RNA polymerase specialized sigma24 family protein